MVRRKDFILPDANVKANFYGKVNSTVRTRDSGIGRKFKSTNHEPRTTYGALRRISICSLNFSMWTQRDIKCPHHRDGRRECMKFGVFGTKRTVHQYGRCVRILMELSTRRGSTVLLSAENVDLCQAPNNLNMLSWCGLVDKYDSTKGVWFAVRALDMAPPSSSDLRLFRFPSYMVFSATIWIKLPNINTEIG